MMVCLRYYPGIFAERLKKTTTKVKHDGPCPDRDLNRAPPRATPLSQLEIQIPGNPKTICLHFVVN
jgi:hypothetical protein